MQREITDPVSYAEAMAIIVATTHPVDAERLPLSCCYGRIPFNRLKARYPEPGYDQSQRDGYAIGEGGEAVDDDVVSFSIITEIPAGRSDMLTLGTGQACRIMTGAMVPSGAVAVIPQEKCRVDGKRLLVPGEVCSNGGRHIQKRGSLIADGTVIAEQGSYLGPNSIGVLAATGVRECLVHRQVRVGLFCSGSELIDIDQRMEPGKKVSSNRYLLDCLIRSFGALPQDFGIGGDEQRTLAALLGKICMSDADIIISTGGLGPGKYDLLESVFEQAGGRLHFRSLKVRPGKATLFGTINGKVYFGLPGPPPAVRILFNEFIVPALKRMAGASSFAHRDEPAFLDHEVSMRKDGMRFIREGVRITGASGCRVRLASGYEEADCTVLLPEGVSCCRIGDPVTIHDAAGSRFS